MKGQVIKEVEKTKTDGFIEKKKPWPKTPPKKGGK